MNPFDTFIHAVSNCTALPELLRNAAASVVEIETSAFNETYLEFLDQQIEFNTRGEEWSQRLRSRRSGLAEWCDMPLIGGRITLNNDEYTIKVDPKTQSVVYWEHYAGSR